MAENKEVSNRLIGPGMQVTGDQYCDDNGKRVDRSVRMDFLWNDTLLKRRVQKDFL